MQRLRRFPGRWLAALLLSGASSGCVISPVGALTEPSFPEAMRHKLSRAH